MKQSNSAIARQRPRFSVAIETENYRKLINNTLSDPDRARRFIASITSAVAVNAQLQECDAGTILAGALLGESLNLSPSPQLGQYYLVPFDCKIKGPDGKTMYETDESGKKLKDSNSRWIPITEKRAQFVLGYKGYIQLAIRSGSYSDLDAMEIREGEYLGRDKNTGKPRFQFIENDDERDALPVIGYLAYFEYLNGFHKTLYWSKKKMMAHADQYSSAFNAAAYDQLQRGEIADADMWKYSSYWYKSFDDMAKKTMLRQLISKWGIMSIEMQIAFEKDASLNEIGNDNQLITTPEPQLELAQQNYEMIRGEADQIVEKVDLSVL